MQLRLEIDRRYVPKHVSIPRTRDSAVQVSLANLLSMSERAFPTENLCSKHRIVICPPAVLQFLAMQTIGSPRRRHEVFWRDWFLAFEPHPKLALIQSRSAATTCKRLLL